MKGIILAAGRGSRMESLTNSSPKCLIKFKNYTLLDHQIKAFKKAGINDIGIVTGYKREMLAKYGLHEFYNSNWENTNMVTSLLCAHKWLNKDVCIISYSDIYYKSNAIRILRDSKSDLSLTYDPNWLKLWQERFNDPLDDAESFKIDLKTNHIIEIGQKVRDITKIMGQYMGLIKFTPIAWSEAIKVLSLVKTIDKNKMYLTDLLQKIIGNNIIKIEGINYSSSWAEFDSINDIKVFEKLIE
jgi:L-glutamine-phosphate cytidylyltransferase